MLTSIHFKNWKSLDETTLFLDPLTILIGANGSGKSNIIEALWFLQKNMLPGMGSLDSLFTQNGNGCAIRGRLEDLCRRGSGQFEIIAEGQGDNHPEEKWRYALTVEVQKKSARVASETLESKESGDRWTNLFRTGDPEGDSLPAYFYNGKKGRNPQKVFSRFQCILPRLDELPVNGDYALHPSVLSTTRAVLNALRGIFFLNPNPAKMRGYTPLSETLQEDAGNIAGVMAGLPEKKRVEKKLTACLKILQEPDVQRVYAEKVGKFENDAMLYCEERWAAKQHQTMDARQMSDGTLRFLAILTALITCKPGSLLMVEEIDNGLHPSRARLLVEQILAIGKERKVDVLATTHNPALLNALGYEMLPFVSVVHRNRQTGGSRITLLENLESMPRLMAQGSLGDLSERGDIEFALRSKAG